MKEEKEHIELSKFKEAQEMPFVFGREQFKSSSAHLFSLWCFFAFFGFFLLFFSFFTVLILGLVLFLYSQINTVTLSVMPSEKGPIVSIKESGKTIHLRGPLKINAIWKYDKNPIDFLHQMDTYVFLQVKDAEGQFVTFYESIVLGTRTPSEARQVYTKIEEPQHSYRVQRIDELIAYLSRSLPIDMIYFEDELT